MGTNLVTYTSFSAAMKAEDADEHESVSQAKNTFLGFMIISYVAAVFLLIASCLMSYWMCCGKGTAAAAKKLEYGCICQALAFLTYCVAWILIPVGTWAGLIPTLIDLVWY